MQSTAQAVPVSRGARWLGWIVSILPALLLFFSAFLKFAKPPSVVEGFTKFGYPERLVLILGIIECSCTVIYLIPRTAILGAILLTGYLGGAVATHVRIGDPTFVMPALCGVLVWLGLYLREPRLRRLAPFRSLLR